jgi:spermidine synthase
MSRRFEELSWARTRLGEVSLRRRLEPITGQDVYEVKLGDDFLMSSLFTAAEEAMADLALAWWGERPARVLVGGLGLGYTAMAALGHDQVRSLDVVEALAPVIGWHRERLLPCSAGLVDDPRVHLVEADFFAVVAGADSPAAICPPYECLLLDIDHAPDLVLDPSHQALYTPAGLRRLGALMTDDGVLALWSDRAPDPTFGAVLTGAFDRTCAEVVPFPNPLTGGTSTNTIYLAMGPGGRPA